MQKRSLTIIVIALLCALVTAFALVGCKKDNTNSTDSTSSSSSSSFRDSSSSSSLPNSSSVVEDDYADFMFTQTGNTYELTAYSGNDEVVTVPKTYKGKSVTIIGEKAFYDCSNIRKIVLPDTLKEVGSEAFGYCSNLADIDMPTCVRIMDNAFIGCSALEEIVLPHGMVYLGKNLFTDCYKLKKVVVNSGTILAETFAGCLAKEIEVKNNVESIKPYAFSACKNLETLILPRVAEKYSFDEYYFGIKTIPYTYFGSGRADLQPKSVEVHEVIKSDGNKVIFGVPKDDSKWYYVPETIEIDGITYKNDREPITVDTWEDVWLIDVGVWYQAPKTWSKKFYYTPKGSLKKLVVTNQLISTFNKIFAGSYDIEVYEKYPVKELSVQGVTEQYLDNYNIDNYKLKVLREDGFIEYIPVKNLLTESEIESLDCAGEHKANLTFEGKTCELKIKNNLRKFDGISLEDLTSIYDGTVKSLMLKGKVPDGTETEWKNNGKKDLGEYEVSVTLSKRYYETKTLTAKLNIRQKNYNINYVLNISGASNPNPTKYDYGKEFALKDCTSTSYTFDGWYSDENFTQKVTSLTDTDYGNKTFYAKWTSFFTVSNSVITGLTDAAKNAIKVDKQGKIVIPETINGEKIISIGDRAFYGCTGLTSVTIPDSMESIGWLAFSGCTSLTSVYYAGDVASWCRISGLENIMPWSRTLYIGGNKVEGELVIPNGVKSICDYAFYGYKGLTSVTIPDSVTSIGNGAFWGCDSLISVTIGNSVTSIGDYAFRYCTKLTSVTIGNSVTSIGSQAFEGCTELTSVTIGNSVTRIGDRAFEGCTELTNVTIPDSVESIGWLAFSGCSGLTSVTIGNSVTSIGRQAFNGCTGLTSVTIPDSVTSIGESAFSYCNGLTSVTIGNSVTSIGNGAFWDCSKLTSVTIGNSVTSIGDSAFYGCSGLTSVTIPDSVTSIGNSAFRGCDSLISVTIGCGVTSIGESAFYGCSGLTSVTIPDSVTSIGAETFCYCTDLASVTIGSGVTSIGESAFYGCSGLTSVIIGNGVTSIGTHAFINCDRLTSVTIPDSVTSIGNGAFWGCDSLISVTIGSGVTNIGNGAFWNWSGLTSIYYAGDVASWCGISGLKNMMSSSPTLYIGGKKVECELVIPNGVKSICDYAFYGCTGLTSVTIGNSVTSIGESAFYGCSGLTSVTIPDSVTSIGYYAFKGCTGLTSVTIGNSVTSIGSSTFYGCKGLTSVTIPSSVTSIGTEAFYSCYKLVEVINNSSLNITEYSRANGYVGYYALNVKNGGTTDIVNKNGYLFYIYDSTTYLLGYIGKNTELTLPNYNGKNYQIHNYAFYNCAGLTSVTIPDSATSIGEGAFYGCKGLTSVTIPDSVTSIGGYAFSGCTGLTSATIPSSVTSIGDDAFSGCKGLTSVTIPSSVTSIGRWAFAYCSELATITIPNSVTRIGDYAFVNCSSLKTIYYKGTEEEWNAIIKGSDWNDNTGNYTIVYNA